MTLQTAVGKLQIGPDSFKSHLFQRNGTTPVWFGFCWKLCERALTAVLIFIYDSGCDIAARSGPRSQYHYHFKSIH